MLMIGGVSAEDVADDSVIAQDSIAIDNQYNLASSDVSSVAASNANTSRIDVKVTYEFADDAISPTIKVNDKSVISKEFNSASKIYNVEFNSADILDKLNITVSAPGYLTQYKLVTPELDNSILASVTFDLQASESYKLGRDVTAQADKLLDFKNADDVLAITPAGVPKLNGKTSEEAIEGILNYATGYISYGRGNILMLRQTAVDPIDFCFVTKKGKTLTAAIFTNASTKEVYYGTISEYIVKNYWW